MYVARYTYVRPGSSSTLAPNARLIVHYTQKKTRALYALTPVVVAHVSFGTTPFPEARVW